MRPNKEEAMSTEPKPQENAPEFPYLKKILEFAERVEEREKLEQAGKRGYVSTTSGIVSNIQTELRRQEELEKDWSTVSIERRTLEQAMGPFAALANILTSAGHHGVDLDAGDVGNVLGALAHYAYTKTNGFPSLGECY